MDFLGGALKGRMLFAIPKKGRLYEKCLELLHGADIQFTRSNRLDVALVRNHAIALVFLPAADIPRFVGEGNIDLGITGQDMVAEAGLDSSLIKEELQLRFGNCKLQIQAPINSNYKTEEDLVGKKIVTSFENVAGKYFAQLDKRLGKQTAIEYVGGSVEAACALGLADGIVDLVESGETMRAAGLQAISTILSSQAVLIQSSRPKDPANLPLIKLVTSRIAGVIAAARYVLCTYNIERSLLEQAVKITPGRRAPTITALDEPGWIAVNAMVAKDEAATVMDSLQEMGAHDIFVTQLINCRV